MYQHYDIPQPKWDPKHNKWILSIMIDGKRKQFVSRTPKLPGKKKCRERCLEWLENDKSDNSSKSLATAVDDYLEDYRIRHGNNEQIINLSSMFRSFLIPALGNRKCSTLSFQDWQGVINNAKPVARFRKDGTAYCKTQKLSRKYLSNIKGAIISFCKWAYPRHYLNEMPADLYLPSDAPTIGKEILQLSDIEKLFTDPIGLWYERALMFEVLTGWRPGEVLGLQRSDYDPGTGIITVNRSLNARGIITPGKNKNARRTIELTSEVRAILNEQLEDTAYLESEWIFCNPLGDMPNQAAVRKCWKRIVKRKGLPEATTPYSLRHTFFTHTESYLPDRIIKTIFGHSQRTDSHNLYGVHHVSEEAHEAAQRLAVTPIYKSAFKEEKVE